MNIIEILNYRAFCEAVGISACKQESLDKYFKFKNEEIKL